PVFLVMPRTTMSSLLPYTTLFRSDEDLIEVVVGSIIKLDGAVHQTELLGAQNEAAGGIHFTQAELGKHVLDHVVGAGDHQHVARSEEHTSELQSRENLVCRLLLEK